MTNVAKQNKRAIGQHAKQHLKNMEYDELVIKKERQEHGNWWNILNWNDQYCYPRSASTVLSADEMEKAYRNPVKILSVLLKTDDISPRQIQKMTDYTHQPFNFSFGTSKEEADNTYETMLNSEKIVLGFFDYSYNTSTERGRAMTTRITTIRLMAPTIDERYPVFYDFEIITEQGNDQFCGINAVAHVGGFVEGYCPLFSLLRTNSGNTRLYTVKSGHTKYQIDWMENESTRNFEVTSIGPKTFDETLDFVFDKFGVSQMLTLYSNQNASKIKAVFQNSKSLLKPIKGSEFVKTILSKNDPKPGRKQTGQLLSDARGRTNTWTNNKKITESEWS